MTIRILKSPKCWSWNSNTLAIECEELTHWKRPWCWEGLGAGGEGDDRGWNGWMASLSQWTWVWVNSGRWWWTGRPGVLRFMGLQSQTQLSNWTELSDRESWRGKDHGFLEKGEEGSPANRRILSQNTEARMWMSLGDCEESLGILERNAIKQVGPDFEDAQVSLSSLSS